MEDEERSLADSCDRKRGGRANPPPMRRRGRLGRAMQRMFWCLVLVLMMPGEGTLIPAGIVELGVAGGMEGGSSGPPLRQWRNVEVPRDFMTVLEALQLRATGTQIKV